jgi:hypothetical protein
MIYRYCTTCGFDIHLKLRLKASLISDFNDPFELDFGINTVTAKENILGDLNENPGLIKPWVATLKEQGIEVDEASIDDVVEKMRAFQIRDLRRVGKDIRNRWLKTLGVCCFSRQFDIIQMWAHYSDNHKGIVVGFDESKLTKVSAEIAEIEYRDDKVQLPVHADPRKIKVFEPLIKSTLHRKEIKWKYEEEVRIYVGIDEKDVDGNYYYNGVPPESIREIYLGLRSPETTEIVAKDLDRRPHFSHLKVFKMDVSDDEYKLVPRPIQG